MEWKKLSSEYLLRHKYFTARKDRCETPEGKIIEEYFVVELPVSACALGLTEEGDVVMVKQYRHPIGQTILELPGGFVDDNEKPEKAIARELLEETGYEFSSIQEVGKVYANPGVLDGYTVLFLATGGKKISEQNLDFNEDIEIVTIPLVELKKLFFDNKILQSLHANCIFYALQKLGEI